jgi:serine/threonine-protein kinase
MATRPIIDDPEVALRDNLERLGIDLALVTVDQRGTISPPGRGAAAIHVGSLPLLDLGEMPMFDARPRFDMGDAIGGGGMGVVSGAHQEELGREVALKMLRPDRAGEGAEALLREALVTGMLQHPNLVPVHALGRTVDSSPVMVMKRIDGTRWPEAMPLPPGQGELCDHLEVLLQVCDAVAYAHARGIVHRDLKLDNVMIGSFGEVYVLDWGLAVSLREDDAGRLPLAREVDTLAGTPAFMAPEMALCGAVDERTDIYLLGAMLHEIVTGGVRHDAKDVERALLSAVTSEPVVYDDAVPIELGEICNCAMQRDPNERYRSVDAFRAAVDAFVKHEPSRTLAVQASFRLARMEEAAEHHNRGIEMGAQDFHRLASEARFAYQEALRQYPDNSVAARGLRRTVELMVLHEIRRDNVGAAEDLMTELAAPSNEVRAALAALNKSQRDKAREVEDLSERARQTDLRQHTPERRRYLIWLGSVICAVVLVTGALNDLGIIVIDYPQVLAAAAVCALATLYGAKRMAGQGVNVANQRFANANAIVCCNMAVFLGVTFAIDVPLGRALSLVMIVAASVTTVVAMIMARGMLFTALAFALGGLGMVLWPERDYEIMALGLAVGFALAAFPLQRFVASWHRPIIDVEPSE